LQKNPDLHLPRPSNDKETEKSEILERNVSGIEGDTETRRGRETQREKKGSHHRPPHLILNPLSEQLELLKIEVYGRIVSGCDFPPFYEGGQNL
tara:strand:+ start:176 stop:457 length:282 start_codon:yes stop_codon:yes gene_type:complete